MPIITLPDGSQKKYDHAVTVADVAASIGAGLAKAALAGKINDRVVDLSHLIDNDVQLRIITDKDPEGLEVIRHSSAHLLAHAVKILFPSAQVTIGPVIEDGFYYDFSFERPFTPDDLKNIELKMQELAKQHIPILRKEISRPDAIQFFKNRGEHFKARIIEELPSHEKLTIYEQDDFTDLCRGPHVPHTGKLVAFKLTKLSGAYWRGDAKNEMLQRIYGTAWTDKKTLENYLKQLEEVDKRDHRKIAAKLDLFHFQDEAPSMVFWHPNGWTIYQQIKTYISQQLVENEYEEVSTPQLVDIELWKKSGHWDMFGENMFVIESENRTYAVKPMNCPCHIQIFKNTLRSYRDLPLRFAEYGCLHRNEASGALHGLMRVRRLVQDDAHIFCTEEQIQDEATKFIHLLLTIYRDFGFNDLVVKLATRPEKRVGTAEQWDLAEAALAEALKHAGLDYSVCPGEGAFYGPKIEFHLRDCLNRLWQCGTLQLDYTMPNRLDAYYIAEDSSKKTPVMLHRAIVGSFERFIGILLEHYAGKLPVWLAPTQAIVMNITDKQLPYAEKITRLLKNQGIRAKSDLRNEKISYKIREHTLAYVPYLLIVGDRETESEQVTVRTLQGDDLGMMSLNNFLNIIKTSIAQKGRIAEKDRA